jgi:hypothetical protein
VTTKELLEGANKLVGDFTDEQKLQLCFGVASSILGTLQEALRQEQETIATDTLVRMYAAWVTKVAQQRE